MRPGPQLVRILGLLCLAALLVPLVPGFVFVLAAALAAVLASALAEAWLLRRVAITVDVPASLVVPLGDQELLPVALRTNSARPIHLTLRQVWPDVVEPAAATRRGVCRPGELLRLELPVRGIARGKRPLSTPSVAAFFWGLAERITSAGAVAELSVLPDLRAVGRLHAKLNQFVLRGLGTRTSARLGKGREFDRLRDYVRGDEFRDIAWKASARHGKLIVREYRIDRSQDVLVCLDQGHRMEARVARLTKLDHAVNAAVLLAYICNRMEDRIGLLSFATDVTLGAPQGRGSAHLRRFTAFAASVQGGHLHSDYLVLAADLRRRLRHRTLVTILTALPELEHETLLQAVGLLASQHLPLVVVLTDPQLEAAAQLLPADKAELARTLAAQDVLWGREQTVRGLRRRGALVVETPPGDAGTAAMNAYIDVKRRQLL
jgi:uncharacterized protein (DUF58 family)